MESLMADQLASTVPATRIDTRDLRFVVKALHEFGEHWERIGEDLNVSNLKKITLDYDGVVSLCLIVMVDCLLRGRLIKNPGRPATWREIVRVVYHTNPAHAHLLAGKLNEFQKFSPGQLAQTVDDSPLVDEFPSDADIKKVVSQLHSLLVPAVAGRWFEIGALLGLPLNSLTIIRSDSALPDPRDKLRKVLYEWLTFAEDWELETPSWQVLVDVVAHGAGGDEPGLAWEIADKHGKSGSGSIRGPVPDSTPHSYPPAASATQPGATAPFCPPGASAKPKRPTLPELNPGSHIIVKSEHVNYLAELLYPIAPNWELFVRELGVADRDVNRIRANNSSLQTEHGSSFGDFARKCLDDGLYDWMLMDPRPNFAKIMRILQSGLFSDATLAAKVEAYGERLLKDQQVGGSVKSDQEGAIFMQPTPDEEYEEQQPSAVLNGKQEEPKSKQPSPGDLDEEYDSSGDEADRVTDDGWPWSGEKTHYPSYKRKSDKTSKITLQEQNGDLTTICPKRSYIRQGKPEEFYPMNPAKLPHGIALIISNKFFADSRHGKREGTEKDVRNLRKAFRYLGYEVLIRRDCTSIEMEGFFKQGGLVFQKAKKEHDSFVCCILSHGSSNEVIGADSKPVNIGQQNGVQYEVAHCDTLKKKPKLFFIQACRGSGTDDGLTCDSGTENRIQSDFSVVPTKSDYYISYATVQGQKSTRHMDHGSRYVLELCRALVTDGHNSTLSSMQKAVNKSVGEYDAVTYQQSLAEDSLTSSVYFFEDQLKETAV